jgi:hypothetical protein
MDPITGIVGLAGVSIAALGGLFIKPKKEGFQTIPSGEFRQYVDTGAFRYNNLSQILDATQNALIPLNASEAQANQARRRVNNALRAATAQTSSNQQTLSLTPPSTNLLPRRDTDQDLLAKIDFCNKRLQTTNTPFDDPRFKENCGVCIRSGVDEKGVRFTGKKGLYISPVARSAAVSRKETENLFFIPAAPSLAKCDGAPEEPTFALSKEDLEKFEKRETCKTTKSLDGECGKCFEEETYTYVGKQPDRSILSIVIQGQGRYSLTVGARWFRGTLTASPRTLTVGRVSEGVNATLLVETIRQRGRVISPLVAGFLVSTLPNGTTFRMPLNRIFTTDTETGGNPRFSGQVVEIQDGTEPAAFLQTGRGKTKMNLIGQIPFTFLSASEFAVLDCDDNPLQTKVESLSKPITNPCFQKGQTPGNYNDECLRQVILDSGCTNAGSLFKSPQTLNQLNGRPQSIQSIVRRVQQIASRDGFSNTESQQCSGRTIESACQAFQNDPGAPIHAECLATLYKNTGARLPRLGATYTTTTQYQNSTPSEPNLFCSTQGQLNPILPNGSINTRAVITLQQIGLRGFQGERGVAAVKAYLDNQMKIAIDPNQNAYTSQERQNAILGCFGRVNTPVNTPRARPEVFAVGPGYDFSQQQAPQVCARFGARVATEAELRAAQQNGAEWCFAGWVSDTKNALYPMNSRRPGCGNATGVINFGSRARSGVNCFGFKPPQSQAPGVKPFSRTKWSQSS